MEIGCIHYFDISKCRCDISETCQVYKDKCLCSCKFENRIPAAELKFLLDQRSSRRMIFDIVQRQKFQQTATIKLKRRNEVEMNVVSATSSSKRKVAKNSSVHSILPNKLRPRMSIVENGVDASQNAIIIDAEESKQLDPDYQDPAKYVKDGKAYKKVRSFSISTGDCVKADRRLTSIRQ